MAVGLLIAVSAALAAERPEVVHTGLVAPDVIEIALHCGHVEYGRQVSYENQWGQKNVNRFAHPRVEHWPSLEAFFDVFWYPPMCEFTVHQPMATNAYVWGYLAARR
ncbi:MAG: hypothetical protein ACODAJ_02585 [Planctomycetota bacterium]